MQSYRDNFYKNISCYLLFTIYLEIKLVLLHINYMIYDIKKKKDNR